MMRFTINELRRSDQMIARRSLTNEGDEMFSDFRHLPPDPALGPAKAVGSAKRCPRDPAAPCHRALLDIFGLKSPLSYGTTTAAQPRLANLK